MENKQLTAAEQAAYIAELEASVVDLKAKLAESAARVVELEAEVAELRPALSKVIVTGEWEFEHETPEGKTKSRVKLADGMTHIRVVVDGFPRVLVPSAALLNLASGKVPKVPVPELDWAMDGKKPNGKALQLMQFYLSIRAGWLLVVS